MSYVTFSEQGRTYGNEDDEERVGPHNAYVRSFGRRGRCNV